MKAQCENLACWLRGKFQDEKEKIIIKTYHKSPTQPAEPTKLNLAAV